MYVSIPPVSVPAGSNTSPAKDTERVITSLSKVTCQDKEIGGVNKSLNNVYM